MASISLPDLSNLNNNSGISGLMSLPNSSYPYFWAWILGTLWVIFSLTMYFTDKEKVGKERILSSLAVAAFAVIILAAIGTVFTIVTMDIMIYILVFGLLIIAVWFLSTK